MAVAGEKGSAGVSNRGLGNEGLHLEAHRPYEGYIYVRADPHEPLDAVAVALEDHVAATTLARAVLPVPAAARAGFVRLEFVLTPTAGTACEGIAKGSDPAIDCGGLPGSDHICVRCAGQFVISIGRAGRAWVGFAFLQPGAWGRFRDLPVLASGVRLLQDMGITAIRQGGTFAQTIVWKEWRGPPERRKSMQHKWRYALVAGWGPFEMVDLCNAAGIVPIVALQVLASERLVRRFGHRLGHRLGLGRAGASDAPGPAAKQRCPGRATRPGPLYVTPCQGAGRVNPPSHYTLRPKPQGSQLVAANNRTGLAGDCKNSQTTPATTSTTPIRQPLGAADAQTVHHAISSTAPAHQPLGSANAETTPAGAPAAAADRKQRPDATCEGENG